MLIELIVNIFTATLKTLLSLLPNIPQLPNSLSTSLNNVFTTIFNNVGLIGLFFRISTIKILVPLVIVVVNFEHIYHFIMWIIKKLPLSVE